MHHHMLLKRTHFHPFGPKLSQYLAEYLQFKDPPPPPHPDVNSNYCSLLTFQEHHLMQIHIWICNIFRLGAMFYTRRHGHEVYSDML